MSNKKILTDDELNNASGAGEYILPGSDSNPSLNSDNNKDVFPEASPCDSFVGINEFNNINNSKCINCKYFYYPAGTACMGKCGKTN